MKLRLLVLGALLGVLALVAGTSAAFTPLPSAAAFSDMVELSPNTATATPMRSPSAQGRGPSATSLSATEPPGWNAMTR